MADVRELAASLQSFLHDDDLTPGIVARRDAGLDRSSSKDDRTSAADDRLKLTADSRTPSATKSSEDDPD